jgi:hypothetical protein
MGSRRFFDLETPDLFPERSDLGVELLAGYGLAAGTPRFQRILTPSAENLPLERRRQPALRFDRRRWRL